MTNSNSPRKWCLVAVLAIPGLVGLSARAETVAVNELTQQQRDGKRIYYRGESNSGRPVFASLGDPPMQISAKMLPCVNCHGYDGRGLSEAGIESSNISWSTLIKPYRVTQPTGRRRSAYDETTLRRAITQGIDPSTNKLGVGMPHFLMDDIDMASLIAYIKRIETDIDPGVTDTQIVLATILPPHGPGKSSAQAVGDLLRARFKQVNDKGGVYGRKIKLHEIDVADSSTSTVDKLRNLLKTEPVFAIITPWVPGESAELVTLAIEREIPIIIPITSPPFGVDETNRFVFYLHSGLDTQTKVLVDDLVQQDDPEKKLNYAILTHKGGVFEQLAHVVKDRFDEHGMRNITITTDDKTITSIDRITKLFKIADGVFLFGADTEVNSWLTHAKRTGASPKILMVSASFGKQTLAATQSYDGHLVCAFSNTNQAQSPEARAAFQTFLQHHKLSTTPDAASTTAYCAVNLFMEGLQNAGRKLRRERLILELEGLYEFSTGLTRDVTFGPIRRVGVSGAYIVTFDPHSQSPLPNSRWVDFVD